MFAQFRDRIFSETPESDRSVAIGVGMALFLIALAILAGGKALNFIDPISLLMVLGGTCGATLASYSFYDLRHCWHALRNTFEVPNFHPIERISYMLSLAQVAKRHGLLSLEREAQETSDPFLRLAMELAVDSQQHQDVRRILETEMRIANDRSLRAVQVLEALGNFAPAMGLIGTLIGLIQMLGSLSDPSSVGPAMALALITTFYGALFSNVVFLPLAGRLRNRTEEANVVKFITIEGILSIARQESPVLLEQKLQSFIPLAANGL